MTAKAHGLHELEKSLEEAIEEMENKDEIYAETKKFLTRSKALLPLRPVHVGNEEFCKEIL